MAGGCETASGDIVDGGKSTLDTSPLGFRQWCSESRRRRQLLRKFMHWKPLVVSNENLVVGTLQIQCPEYRVVRYNPDHPIDSW